MENILFKVAFPAEFHAQTAVEAAFQLHPLVSGRLDAIDDVAHLLLGGPFAHHDHHLCVSPLLVTGVSPRSMSPREAQQAGHLRETPRQMGKRARRPLGPRRNPGLWVERRPASWPGSGRQQPPPFFGAAEGATAFTTSFGGGAAAAPVK